MSKIQRIELFNVDIPLKKPFYPSWISGYPQLHNRFTLIRLTTDDGIVGVSAGVSFETERQGLGKLIGPYLMGLDPTDVGKINQRLKEVSYLGWRNSWIEPAFWDIRGKMEGKPVYKLLQEREEEVKEVRVYCSTGEIQPAKKRLESIDKIRELGFKAVKLRVRSATMEEDVDIVREVRKRVGDDFGIMVDANQGWLVTIIDEPPRWDLGRAISYARECERLGVLWLEEPLDMYAYDDLSALREATKTPIAGGELSAGWHELKIMIEKGCFNIYQPDATFAGGISASRKVMEECLRRDLGFSPHTWTNGIGLLINLQVYAAFPRKTYLEYPYESPGWIPASRDAVLESPIVVSPRGTIPVPNTPGLGIAINERALRKYGKKFYTLTPFRLAVQSIRRMGLKTTLELAKKKGVR
ncbi:MAG: mandelate racemase/muconate lactonizing enzyme family protein [Deltaproteobacteria bacterium]|nr:MAG: mandelate racemase/muconate lactonizing enzyme family protein [Deltaproteobacteria bacterium]